MRGGGRVPALAASGDRGSVARHVSPPDRLLKCNDDVWFAPGGEYRVYRRSLAGDTTVVFTLEGVRPAAVDEADRDEVRAPFERRPNPALMGDYLRALPENKPVIAGLFVDGAGHVFVVPETSRGDAGTAIDVFREDGVFLGRFEPSRMAPRPAAFIASRLRCPESRG